MKGAAVAQLMPLAAVAASESPLASVSASKALMMKMTDAGERLQKI
jgi:hypothetical protein